MLELVLLLNVNITTIDVTYAALARPLGRRSFRTMKGVCAYERRLKCQVVYSPGTAYCIFSDC